MSKLLSFFIFIIITAAASANGDDREIETLFSEKNIDGTIVISSLNSSKNFIYNTPRANKRFAAASTFKILNPLISLKENAISAKNHTFKWDGHIYSHTPWNGDQSLKTAFRTSCVWCYQDLARQVGADKYRSYIHKLSYGKLSEPFEETTFWLDGSLKISAIEQVKFLKSIYLRSPAFSQSSYQQLQQIMIEKQTPDYIIRAKTGWAERLKPQVGWYVGYVEKKDEVWFFASNIVIRKKSDLPLRQKLTREILKIKGILTNA